MLKDTFPKHLQICINVLCTLHSLASGAFLGGSLPKPLRLWKKWRRKAEIFFFFFAQGLEMAGGEERVLPIELNIK